ncbi:ATP-binding protein [Kitasatospora sp. NPDC059571]|uniref:ATP-binding protein n=1 Tax=Kitasatospora sp. NPDC059571 TaxID=3346871 RepID=UPI0036B54913
MTTSSATTRHRHLGFRPGEPTGVGVDVVRQALCDWHLSQVAIDATIVAAELLANATQHTPGPSCLDLEYDGTTLRITVTDPLAAPPRPRPHVPDRDHGHGMFIVQRVASAWGHRPCGTGKEVWAEFTA